MTARRAVEQIKDAKSKLFIAVRSGGKQLDALVSSRCLIQACATHVKGFADKLLKAQPHQLMLQAAQGKSFKFP